MSKQPPVMFYKKKTIISKWIKWQIHRFASNEFTFRGVDSRVCFWCTYKLPHLHCDKLPLQSTCLNSLKWPQKYLPKQSVYLRGGIRNWTLVCFHMFYSNKITALEHGFIVFSIKITIFWYIFIVFTSINSVIQVVVSIISSSSFLDICSLFFTSTNDHFEVIWMATPEVTCT